MAGHRTRTIGGSPALLLDVLDLASGGSRSQTETIIFLRNDKMFEVVLGGNGSLDQAALTATLRTLRLSG